MSRRHTLTSPEQRKLPRSGATRLAVRKAYVAGLKDNGGRLTHAAAHVVGWFNADGSLEEADGVDPFKVEHALFSGRVIYQEGANRKVRRATANDTRLKNGRPRTISRDAMRTAVSV
jgi:hypothetical protein